jgi:hypothetical protein
VGSWAGAADARARWAGEGMARWAAAGAGVGRGVRGLARGVLARGGGGEEGRELGRAKGATGPAELGQGGSWAEFCFSFSFSFPSLFYLFQLDTMRK